MEFANHVRANLGPEDTLFRWTGPALLALMPREFTIDRLRSEFKSKFERSIDKEVDVGGRKVQIPLAASHVAFGLVAPIETIIKHVDAFVASRVPKDYI
jgi:hypothetical protein